VKERGKGRGGKAGSERGKRPGKRQEKGRVKRPGQRGQGRCRRWAHSLSLQFGPFPLSPTQLFLSALVLSFRDGASFAPHPPTHRGGYWAAGGAADGRPQAQPAQGARAHHRQRRHHRGPLSVPSLPLSLSLSPQSLSLSMSQSVYLSLSPLFSTAAPSRSLSSLSSTFSLSGRPSPPFVLRIRSPLPPSLKRTLTHSQTHTLTLFSETHTHTRSR
jgi:hypothetical protein